MLMSDRKVEWRPHLSVLALLSFLSVFVVIRAFTMLSPSSTFSLFGFHIHHFWYGLILLIVAGWVGITCKGQLIDEFAAMVFGAGGALVGDEVGILLTFDGKTYWGGVSYTAIMILVTSVLIVVFFARYSRMVLKDFGVLAGNRRGFIVGVLLTVGSLAFLVDTDSIIIIAFSSMVAAVGCALLVWFFARAIRTRVRKAPDF